MRGRLVRVVSSALEQPDDELVIAMRRIPPDQVARFISLSTRALVQGPLKSHDANDDDAGEEGHCYLFYLPLNLRYMIMDMLLRGTRSRLIDVIRFASTCKTLWSMICSAQADQYWFAKIGRLFPRSMLIVRPGTTTAAWVTNQRALTYINGVYYHNAIEIKRLAAYHVFLYLALKTKMAVDRDRHQISVPGFPYDPSDDTDAYKRTFTAKQLMHFAAFFRAYTNGMFPSGISAGTVITARYKVVHRIPGERVTIVICIDEKPAMWSIRYKYYPYIPVTVLKSPRDILKYIPPTVSIVMQDHKRGNPHDHPDTFHQAPPVEISDQTVFNDKTTANAYYSRIYLGLLGLWLARPNSVHPCSLASILPVYNPLARFIPFAVLATTSTPTGLLGLVGKEKKVADEYWERVTFPAIVPRRLARQTRQRAKKRARK